MSEDGYTFIPFSILHNKELTPQEKILLEEVCSYKDCYISNTYIAELMNYKDVATASRLVKSLCDKGYLRISGFNGKNRKLELIDEKVKAALTKKSSIDEKINDEKVKHCEKSQALTKKSMTKKSSIDEKINDEKVKHCEKSQALTKKSMMKKSSIDEKVKAALTKKSSILLSSTNNNNIINYDDDGIINNQVNDSSSNYNTPDYVSSPSFDSLEGIKEYTRYSVKGQDMMRDFRLTPDFLELAINAVWDQFVQLGKTKHKNAKDLDSHIRSTLAMWNRTGDLKKICENQRKDIDKQKTVFDKTVFDR